MIQTKSLQEYAKISSEDSLAKIDSSKSGLTDQEAQKRMEKYGKNVIATTQRQSMLKTFLTNFTSMMAIHFTMDCRLYCPFNWHARIRDCDLAR